MLAEQDIAENLMQELNINSQNLKLEGDYIDLGKKVAEVLYKGEAPYRIPAFFKELVRDLATSLESKKIKEILDSVTTIYNTKVKEEKDKEKGTKKPAKAKLNAGKSQMNEMLVNKLMGDDDGYGEEDEYGNEAPAKGGNKKLEDYDFM